MAGEFFQAGFNIGANNGISDLWKSRAYASDAFKARANNPKKLFLQNEARRLAKELWEADSDKRDNHWENGRVDCSTPTY